VTPGSRHTTVATGRWLRRIDHLYPVVVNCVKISGVPRSGMVSYVWLAGRLLEVSELFHLEAMYQWWGNLREGDHWGDPGVDGRIILGWIFGKWDVGVWTGWC